MSLQIETVIIILILGLIYSIVLWVANKKVKLILSLIIGAAILYLTKDYDMIVHRIFYITAYVSLLPSLVIDKERIRSRKVMVAMLVVLIYLIEALITRGIGLGDVNTDVQIMQGESRLYLVCIVFSLSNLLLDLESLRRAEVVIWLLLSVVPMRIEFTAIVLIILTSALILSLRDKIVANREDKEK